MRVESGLAFLLLAAATVAAPGAEFFVAPNGSDGNPGTIARPFATIRRAQGAVRNAAGAEPVTVNLREGTYYLAEPIIFKSRDSGTSDWPVIYRAHREEKAKISGGRRLSLQWEDYKSGIKKAKIDKMIVESSGFDQLFLNGERQHMARFPNRNPDAYVFDGVTSFDKLCRRARGWEKPQTGFMHAIHVHRWGSVHYRVVSVDHDKGTLQLEGGWQQNRISDFRKGQVMVENIFEELDAPGEWYLNRDEATLYFYPEP
ncbi:MAG: hypothetical protein PVJ86_07210, partial [Phycisphaerales bacterium]